MIDQAIVRDAAMLTAIGVGTAFSLLIVLTLIVTVVGRVLAAFPRLGGLETTSAGDAGPGAAQASGEERDKALAAAIAVTVAMERSKRTGLANVGADGDRRGVPAAGSTAPVGRSP